MSAMNPMGLSPTQGASIVGNVSAQPQQDAPTSPTQDNKESQVAEFLTTFRDTWQALEDLNSKYSGDQEAFRNMQKSAENWISTIVPNLTESPNQSTY